MIRQRIEERYGRKDEDGMLRYENLDDVEGDVDVDERVRQERGLGDDMEKKRGRDISLALVVSRDGHEMSAVAAMRDAKTRRVGRDDGKEVIDLTDESGVIDLTKE